MNKKDHFARQLVVFAQQIFEIINQLIVIINSQLKNTHLPDMLPSKPTIKEHSNLGRYSALV